MRNLAQLLRRNRKVIALFVLMVLLPAVVFSVLIVRAVRGERMRSEYEKGERRGRWYGSGGRPDELALLDRPRRRRRTAPPAIRANGGRIVFPDFHLSLSSADSPRQRPFDSAPPSTPPTTASISEQYFPRIQAFLRDLDAGRHAGAQYFPRLRALVVRLPGRDEGYVGDIQAVLGHLNTRLAEFSAAEPFRAVVWIEDVDRTSQPPPGGIGLQGFPFFQVVFEDAGTPEGLAGLRRQVFPYSMSLLLLITVLGSVFVYRAVSHEARLSRLRNEFVAAVSHEFRSPLSSILALVERLESSRIRDPEKLSQYHQIIGQDARRLSTLVTRLLDFAQIEEGKTVYSLERIDLATAAREAVESCGHAGRPDRIRLLGAETPPLWVRADRIAVHHAIQNVIENAMKYSPADAPVDVRCSSANGVHVVDIIDRGVGIAADERGRIFAKFYRGRQALELNVQGVGIGLALVRHVIESHGGSITVDSEPGRGSRFSLSLPRA